MPLTLIIGYGNTIRGDDGAGPRAVELLQAMVASPDVELLALHQLTPELMEPISRASRVIFIDAAAAGTPGEVRQRPVEPDRSSADFTHHATPGALLAGAQALYGRAAEAYLITVTGGDFSLSSELTSLVSQSLDQVCATVLRLLP